MAIKGKKRSRGGRSRARAVAPRPQLIVPKKPLFQRTWVRATLVGLLVLAVSGLTLGVIAARRAAVEREEAQREVTRVGDEMEQALTPVAEINGSSMSLMRDLDSTIIEIQNGEGRSRRVERRVAAWEEDLRTAIAGLEAIETDRGDLRRSIRRIEDALEMYTVLVRGVPDLLALERDLEIQQAVVALQPQLQAASGTAQSGWLIYLNERVDVGLDEGTPGLDTQLPGANPFDVPGPGEVPVPQAPAPEPTG